MKTYQLFLDKLEFPNEKIAICLGYFDGVHLAHKEIIKEALNSKYKVALLTFDKPLSTILNNNKSKEVLTSLNDRFRIINRLGVDYYYVLHVDANFVNLTKFDFIDILHKLNVQEIYVGEDYSFGKNKEGNNTFLKQYFKVHEVPLLKIKGEKVSTQEIIALLKKGDVKKANSLIGQNYLVSGIVEKGMHNGEKIGFKTANIKLNDNYVMPKYGVYKVIAYLEGIPHLAIANVGVHPSIDQINKPIIEVHIPNFNEELYGKSLNVEFLDFMRPEIKFSSIDDLIKQISNDVSSLSKYLDKT